ncbi:MAG: chromosome partitioning protein [Frankiaceae bacterium]
MNRAASIPVLTAVADAAWEARLVAELTGSALGVTVVRRCVDVADLLAVAATGVAKVAVVSADLRRLDRDALARLNLAGVAVVGVVAVVGAADEDADRRLRQLGVSAVVPRTADAAAVAAAILAASARPASASAGFAVPGTPARTASPTSEPTETGGAASGAPLEPGTGALIAVWGPAGAPGRTSVAIGLTAEFGAQGRNPLLVDADVYGGTVSAHLGMLEETPGLAAACRLANAGTLDLARLAALARSCSGGMRVLPGISRPARWPELRTAAFETVLDLCRSLASITVIDCGFSLERDEDLMYDTAAPQRNGATLAALAAADTVVVVGSGDPVGISRVVRGLAELAEVVPGVRPQVVINRARRVPVGGDPKKHVDAALSRYAGVVPAAYVPYDLAAHDAAVAAGRTVAEVAPNSLARKAVGAFAGHLAGDQPTGTYLIGRRRFAKARRS